VTTPSKAIAPLGSRRMAAGSRGSPRHGGEPGDRAPRQHVVGGLPDNFVAPAAVWSLASGAPASGIRRLGNTAGSNAGPDKYGRTRDADTSGDQGGGRWSDDVHREYAGDVPREVVLPNGPPEGLRLSLSGILMDLRLNRTRQPLLFQSSDLGPAHH